VQKAKPNWRLSKTLSRKTEIRALGEGDLFYAWAAYKKGVFDDVFPPDLPANEFNQHFSALIGSRYDAGWTLLAETRKGFIPAGFALGFWPHRAARPFLLLDALVWFPWASPRNRVEATVDFVNKVRRETPMLAFARLQDKHFMETLARHGIVRRIGTSNNIFADSPASVWETNKD
jgi:hypothetical protein